jgi:LEA14-like dessication related protein
MMTATGIASRGLRLFTPLLAVVAAVLTLSACGVALKKPDVSVAEVRVAGFDPESVQLTVTLKVQNPNAVEISLTDIKAKFWIADTEAGEIEPSQVKYVLAPSSSVMLPLKVNVPAKSLPALIQKSVLALIQGGLPYRVEGSVTTGNGLMTIPFNKTGEIAKRL